jgi:hypothetical protein
VAGDQQGREPPVGARGEPPGVPWGVGSAVPGEPEAGSSAVPEVPRAVVAPAGEETTWGARAVPRREVPQGTPHLRKVPHLPEVAHRQQGVLTEPHPEEEVPLGEPPGEAPEGVLEGLLAVDQVGHRGGPQVGHLMRQLGPLAEAGVSAPLVPLSPLWEQQPCPALSALGIGSWSGQGCWPESRELAGGFAVRAVSFGP